MPRTKKENKVEPKVEEVTIDIKDGYVNLVTEAEYLPTVAIQKVLNQIVQSLNANKAMQMASLMEEIAAAKRHDIIYLIVITLLLISSISRWFL